MYNLFWKLDGSKKITCQLWEMSEGDLFGGVKHEYATHPRALECSACFSPLN